MIGWKIVGVERQGQAPIREDGYTRLSDSESLSECFSRIMIPVVSRLELSNVLEPQSFDVSHRANRTS